MLLLKVSELNSHLRNLLEADELAQDIWVEGEISNLKKSSAGHLYFTLKDDTAAIDVAMWRSYTSRLTQPLSNGEAVLAHGRVSIYETSGRLQLYVDQVRPAGVGVLHARFEELKARLASEGLFDESRKRELPPLPRRIGVATSAQGAALQDITTVLERRYPLAEILLASCTVQGEQAPPSIVQALNTLYTSGSDVIILARGGGSLEDLWCFNEEVVARAVFASPIPLITGVGHETDTTIVDYVADVRAPTPSAAAELAVPDLAELQTAMIGLYEQLAISIDTYLVIHRNTLEQTHQRLERYSPLSQISQHRQRVDELSRQADRHFQHRLQVRQLELRGLQDRLTALSPRATLERGYAVVQRVSDKQVVSQIEQAPDSTLLRVRLRDGNLIAAVTEREEREEEE